MKSERMLFLGAVLASLLAIAAVLLLAAGPRVSADGPPPFPLFVDPVTSPTALLTQTLTGETEPGAVIDILGGAGWAHGEAGDDGLFAVEAALWPGVINHLVVMAHDPHGWAFASTTVDRNGDPLDIEQTSTPPTMTLEVDPVTSPTDLLTQTVTGQAEPGAWIVVHSQGGGGWGHAGDDGSFAVETWLWPGVVNHLMVLAYDPHTWAFASTTVDRNGDPLDIEQTSEPPPPPPPPPTTTLEVDPVTSPTDLLTQTVTGETAPDAVIAIVAWGGHGFGGGGGRAGEDGLFAVKVHLLPGVVNHLRVYAFDPATGAWASTAVDRNGDPLDIEQTSTPPPPLTLLVDPVTSPTGLLTQTITGATAPGALIEIAGEGGWADGRAGDDGLFAVEIALAPGITNHLLVIAADHLHWVATRVDLNGDPLNILQVGPPPRSLALAVNPLASPTDLLEELVTGQTAPGADVDIAWEGGIARGQADAGGRFAVAIRLLPGRTNHLLVHAVDPDTGAEATTTVDLDGGPLRVVQTSAVFRTYLTFIVR